MATKKQQTARMADSHVLYCADWTRSIQPEPGKPSSLDGAGRLGRAADLGLVAVGRERPSSATMDRRMAKLGDDGLINCLGEWRRPGRETKTQERLATFSSATGIALTTLPARPEPHQSAHRRVRKAQHNREQRI